MNKFLTPLFTHYLAPRSRFFKAKYMFSLYFRGKTHLWKIAFNIWKNNLILLTTNFFQSFKVKQKNWLKLNFAFISLFICFSTISNGLKKNKICQQNLWSRLVLINSNDSVFFSFNRIIDPFILRNIYLIKIWTNFFFTKYSLE